jgi:proline dehydrogenase
MSLFNKLVIYGLPITPKPIVGYFSKPYIAGPELVDAVNVVKELNSEGIMATIDVLGEEINKIEQSNEAAGLYMQVLDAIKEHNLDSNISLKPTHMGLKLDPQQAYRNIDMIIAKAKEMDNFVRIDMEDHTVTTETIEMYHKFHEKYGENVGTVIQAYMRRTIDDVKALGKVKANIRLCKGIYIEPRRISYRDYWTVNKNFTWAMEVLLKAGSYVGIATHDERLVWEALKLIDELNLKKEDFEFQMLLGVDPLLRKIILDHGYRLRVYVPFGQDWYPYSVRRLKENPNIAKNALQALFRNDQE